MELPEYPFTDTEGEAGWFEGMDLTLDDLQDRYGTDEDKEHYWDLLTEELDSEGEGAWSELSSEQQQSVKVIFDRLWAKRTGGS